MRGDPIILEMYLAYSIRKVRPFIMVNTLTTPEILQEARERCAALSVELRKKITEWI